MSGSPSARALLAASSVLAICIGTTAHADTFGVQAHVMRSRGNLDGREVRSGATPDDAAVPDRLTLRGDGDLVGGSLRGEFLLRGVRIGAGVSGFSVRELRGAESSQPGFTLELANGGGVDQELFVGYELLRGPFYGYVDIRAIAGFMSIPVEITIPSADAPVKASYAAIAFGVGPRIGLLVPIGHSLMVDFAAYQRIVGGLEQTTGFVGIGYWENDRRDRFSQRLKSGTMGDF